MHTPDSHEDLLELLSQSGKAVFAIDSSDRIVLWNTGAERLLGYAAADVLGRNCYGALSGRDVYGNRYCFAECPILKMRDRGETIQPFEIVLESRNDGPRRLRCSILSIPGQRPELTTLVHILSESGSVSPTPAASSPASPARSRSRRCPRSHRRVPHPRRSPSASARCSASSRRGRRRKRWGSSSSSAT